MENCVLPSEKSMFLPLCSKWLYQPFKETLYFEENFEKKDVLCFMPLPAQGSWVYDKHLKADFRE